MSPPPALDQHSADIINKAVSEAVAGCTVITITHRPESLDQAAQVLMLGQGRVIALGDQQEITTELPALSNTHAAMAGPGETTGNRTNQQQGEGPSWLKPNRSTKKITLATVYQDLKPFLALGRNYSGRFALGVLLALGTLLSTIGLLALSGWFITATAVAGLTVASAQIFNFFTPGACVRGFSIGRTASRYGERLVTHDATFRLLASLRLWFFNKVEPLTPAGLKSFRNSELLNRLVADINTLDGLYLRLISPLLLAMASTVALVILSAVWSPKIGIFLLLVMVLALVLLPRLFFRMGQQPGEQTIAAREILRNQLMDYLAGQTELQIYGATARYQAKVTQAEQQVMVHEQRMVRVTGLALIVIAALTGITLVGILVLAALPIDHHQIQGPVVALLTLAAMAAFEAITPLPAAFQMLGQTHSAARRLREVAEQKPAVVFPQHESVGTDKAVLGQLEIDRISFAWPRGEKVVDNVSLTLQPGERVALTGPTGCGKSTLLQLICRDWPCQGIIKLNGQPLEQLTEHQLRRSMAVMPQRIHIFSATLRDNLLLAVDPDQTEQVTDDDLLAVLERVGLTHIATEQSLLDTWIGAAGQNLSGGEQRRVGIARVLLRLRDSCCSLVLLDEPTEGLDPDTEGKMISVLNEALAGRTLLMVTHRPAALELVERSHHLPTL